MGLASHGAAEAWLGEPVLSYASLHPSLALRSAAEAIFRELGVRSEDLRPGFIFNFFPGAGHDFSELRKGSGSPALETQHGKRQNDTWSRRKPEVGASWFHQLHRLGVREAGG